MRRMYSENQLKEIVNKGIESGEINTIKYGSKYEFKKVYHEDNDYYTLDINFDKGFCPLYAKFEDDNNEYIMILFKESGVNVFEMYDSDSIGAGWINIHINENESYFSYELNDGESFDINRFKLRVIFGVYALGDYNFN